MGSQCWELFTPYQENIALAFQQARQQVFDNHDYSDAYLLEFSCLPKYLDQSGQRRWLSLREYTDLPLSQILELHQQALSNDWTYVDDLDQEATSSPPITLEDLDRYLDRFKPPAGTSSILDVAYLIPEAEYPTLGAFQIAYAYRGVRALRSDELIGLYGTDRPTRTLIEAIHFVTFKGTLPSCYPRSWEARYLIVYEDNVPNELFFFGRSQV